MNQPRVLRAGAMYFTLVFVCAFMMGVVRTLWLVPMVGTTRAVLIEVPLVLTISWFIARSIVRRQALDTASSRVAAGLIAFLLLMTAELALAGALADQTPAQWAASLFSVPGIIGLAGQIGFAAMPWLAGRNEHGRANQ